MNLPFIDQQLAVSDFQTLRQDEIAGLKQTIQTLLSSVREARESSSTALSASFLHPFEKLKLEYLGPDAVPLRIDDICVPFDFTFQSIVPALSCVKESQQALVDQQMAILQKEGPNHPHIGNAFAVLSGDQLVIDREKTAKHLQFVDMISKIPIETIISDPLNVARKVLWKFFEIHK